MESVSVSRALSLFFLCSSVGGHARCAHATLAVGPMLLLYIYTGTRCIVELYIVHVRCTRTSYTIVCVLCTSYLVPYSRYYDVPTRGTSRLTVVSGTSYELGSATAILHIPPESTKNTI